MSRKVLTTPYIVWGAAFIILPLFMVLYYGCTGSDGSFTLSNITAMADSVHYKAFWNSVWIALASTLICLVISYPLAYILSKGNIEVPALSLCCLFCQCGLTSFFVYWHCRLFYQKQEY